MAEIAQPQAQISGDDHLAAVLGYHHIGAPPEEWWSWQYVPADVFAAQIEVLVSDGWEPVAPDALLRGLRDPADLPPRAFIVTFDDAYRSLRDDTVVQLERLNLSTVVFAPTDFIGGWNRWDHDVEPRAEICDWDSLRELGRHRVSVQSHGVSHRPFSSIPFAEQEREAADSKRILEEGLGSPVDLLAYPYGDAGDGQRLPGALERAGYRAAFRYGGGAFRLPVENPYLLPRLAMGPDTDVREELRSDD